MSRWDPSWQRGSKKPPPEHGIKLKKAGTTWWGQRWIGALEQVLRGDSGRLSRGRTYARAGRTHDLEIEGGVVTAKVTGSRSTPYMIRIELAQLSAAAWDAAIAGMAAKAQFAAELLAGQMPQEIDEVFVAANCSLFPRQRSELKTSCSCPDWGDPCKHVAATHYVLGEALDRDPFLLFELRGRKKPEVLAALREARGGSALAQDERAPEVPSVELGKLRAQDYDRPKGALPTLDLSFDAPAAHASVLRQLGTPAAWSGDASPAEMFAPLLQAAAQQARRIALAEHETLHLDETRADAGEAHERPVTRTDAEPGPRMPVRGSRRAPTSESPSASAAVDTAADRPRPRKKAPPRRDVSRQTGTVAGRKPPARKGKSRK